MEASSCTMRFLWVPAHLRALITTQIYATNAIRNVSTRQLPQIAQPSLWKSLVPKFVRGRPKAPGKSRTEKFRAFVVNPNTPVLALGILVGSFAIHILNTKKEISEIESKADAKLALLKDVIERVQRGEKVDVEKELGTDDPEQEKEWFEVIEEIESEDRVWRKNLRKLEEKSKKNEVRREKRAEGREERRQKKAGEREERRLKEAQEKQEEGRLKSKAEQVFHG